MWVARSSSLGGHDDDDEFGRIIVVKDVVSSFLG